MSVSDPSIWISITLVSLILSGLFSGVEMAFVTSDRVRVELDVNKGGFIGRIINRFYSNSELFISTILVGNNVVLVIYGMGAAVPIEPLLAQIYNNEVFILLGQTLISTLIILLTGEFLPKTIFGINPNNSFKFMALPMYLFYIVLYPISAFTSWLSRMLMRLVGVKDADKKCTRYLSETSTTISRRQSTIWKSRSKRLTTRLKSSVTPSIFRRPTCATA